MYLSSLRRSPIRVACLSFPTSCSSLQPEWRRCRQTLEVKMIATALRITAALTCALLFWTAWLWNRPRPSVVTRHSSSAASWHWPRRGDLEYASKATFVQVGSITSVGAMIITENLCLVTTFGLGVFHRHPIQNREAHQAPFYWNNGIRPGFAWLESCFKCLKGLLQGRIYQGYIGYL